MKVKMLKTLFYVNEHLQPITLERGKSYVLPTGLRNLILVNKCGFEWGYLNIDNITEETQ